MKNLSLKDILKATGGQALSIVSEKFQGVGTDTRKDLTGQLFVALKGDSYDAHDFLDKAVASHAAALLVHKKPSLDILKQATVILVPDSLKALQDLAHFERIKSKAQIIAITGSNGKTTSKEFAAAVISAHRKVHMPKGSFNNHWGVPLTLLAEPAGTEVSLIEMGMNHSGEIATLCEIAEPDVAVVSMVGQAHFENFKEGVVGIAKAKEEIYQASPSTATRIFNLDNSWTKAMFHSSISDYPMSHQILTFSEHDQKADVFLRLKALTMSEVQIEGSIAGVVGEATVPVFGSQNLVNLMVAASSALAIGMTAQDIWRALPRCRTNWGRNQLVHLKSGAEMLFDGYNANPDSMKALLENVSLLKASGKKIGVFAQMLELGTDSPRFHDELGRQVGKSGFDIVWFYGTDAASFERGLKASGFSKKSIISDTYQDSLASELASVLNRSDTVLVKGSRGMKLERFVMACEPLDFSLSAKDN